ncbi:MAG: hypothetical protein J2P58_10050 [Acidimicrobiaceae bacterium]|nr:hypothetical protein [Acidimicrobiaceae bacterium]
MAILLVAGALLLWAHIYVRNQVYTQLSQQKIFFPPANSSAVAAPEFAPMRQFGGQQMTNGNQARVYANYFIANHLKEIGGGKTYSQLSTQAQAQPNNTKLQDQVNTLFKGETLRGLLLNAYAFGKMGTIALWAAIASFIGAALMLILSVFGILHSRKVGPEEEVLGGDGSRSAAKEEAPSRAGT